ncbi:hypothetical protein BIY29_10090 [Brenneria alni]|uniref:Uncharacterized protein n=1 Tax=Brenneria alni TaxID=71656 RepID=A0A421DNL7_9GAMM|nr:hypothetical protein [Brenneria alni]RLM23643.1 hypothetical protein BIY29_10090 [Brenneria alni]
MRESELELRREIAELRAKIEVVDDWATGMQRVLADVLPPLLRGHPQIAQIHQRLQAADRRYEVLQADPSAAEPGVRAGLYEPGRVLYRLFGIYGVWSDVDPDASTDKSSGPDRP